MHKVWLKWPPTGELQESSDAPDVLVPLMAKGWIQATDAEVSAHVATSGEAVNG